MRTKSRERVALHVDDVIDSTEWSILCMIDGRAEWMPKSQIDPASAVKSHGDSGVLIIPQWLAEKRKLKWDWA